MKPTFIFLALFLSAFLNCAQQTSSLQPQIGLSLLSDTVKSEIKKVEQSIAGINTEITYEIQKFHYLVRNGQMVPDPQSPLKYMLESTNDGITTETDRKTLSGGGLIIDVDNANSKYTVLTSSHLVSPQDTTDIYFIDEKGSPTDVLFARYVVKFIRTSVRGGSVWSSEAKLIADSPADDLAIIQVKTESRIGTEFQNQMGYDIDLSWGDWIFLFGYPKGIKQMTGGWVSKSPYPRTLAVDAVVRFGWSGGSVFTFTKDKTKLAFVGMIKSVPRTNFDYIAPDPTMPVGYSLNPEDFPRLVVKREVLVDYGTAYFVNIKAVKAFINSSRRAITESGIILDPKFYGN